MLKKNVGGFDRIVRIVLGVLILSVAIYYESLWGIVGLVMLGTGALRSCPLYSPFRFSTHREKQNS